MCFPNNGGNMVKRGTAYNCTYLDYTIHICHLSLHLSTSPSIFFAVRGCPSSCKQTWHANNTFAQSHIYLKSLVGIVKQENRLGLLFHTLKYLVFFCFKKDLCDTRESMPNEEDVIPYFAAEGRPSRA